MTAAVEPQAVGDGRRQAAMPFILVTVLIDMVSIGLIIPVLPLIVGQFTASPAEQTFWFGAVAFSFGIANFFGSPILGALSDRHGRRPVLLLGFSGLALSFIVTGLATALWMLIVVRLFSGAMQSNAAVANAYVADITPPEDRARRFGLLGAMFGLGFTLGPVMGGLLGAMDVRLRFTNLAPHAQPAGLGWHPYFPKRARSRLHIELAERWDNDATGLPVRRVAQPGIDADVAHLEFDNCFEGWRGAARLRDEKLSLRLTSSLPYLVVFTPQAKPYYCVEPVGHVSNAIHMADPAAHGLASVEPGQSLEAWMRLEIGSA